MIFYFSGAGNSRYIALKLADALNDKALYIPELIDNNQYEFELQSQERVGFVIPTYFYGMPKIVDRFIQKLVLKNTSYVYLIATCGNTTGQIGNLTQRALEARAITLNAQFSLAMPDTWTPMFDLTDQRKNDKMIAQANQDLKAILDQIQNNVSGKFMRHVWPMLICKLLNGPVYNFSSKTTAFTVEGTCVGCGLCANNCPDHAIEIQDKRPIWKAEKCNVCLKCLHHCPKFAIQFGKHTKKHGQYTI